MSLWTEEEGDCWTRFYELMLAKDIFFPLFPFIISAGLLFFMFEFSQQLSLVQLKMIFLHMHDKKLTALFKGT